jgi:very-short-patch-repair endonuclease
MYFKNKEIDWKEIQRVYDLGFNTSELIKKFGINRDVLSKGKNRKLFVPRTTSEAGRMASLLGKKDSKKGWTKEVRLKQSERKKLLYKLHPEKHPNRLLANNRVKMSYPEKIVYDWLKSQNIEFIHQRKIDKYYVDFNIGKLCIEVDGKRFHEDKEREKQREDVIKSLGFSIRRVSATNIIKNGPSIILDNSIPPEILSQHIDLRKERICITCGGIYYSKNKYCSKDCIQRTRKIKLTTTPRISKVDLVELLKTESFSSIGRKYNVTSNAVKKWCKKYDVYEKKIKDIDIDIFTTLVNDGNSICKISRILKVTRDRIRNYAKKLNLILVDKTPTRHSEKLINDILSLINGGYKCKEISKILNVKFKVVCYINDTYGKNKKRS